ncbi:MAG: hypothetical protein QOE77_3230 [Blastocatellia bacterium]|nr:hypothetical protein [Blastocatellia bacterium]
MSPEANDSYSCESLAAGTQRAWVCSKIFGCRRRGWEVNRSEIRQMLNRDDFQIGINFLLQHSLDGHQCSGQGTGTTTARALIADAKRVFL